jgi:hypothetical protein
MCVLWCIFYSLWIFCLVVGSFNTKKLFCSKCYFCQLFVFQFSLNICKTVIKKDIDYSILDGKRFYYSFLAGSQRLFDNQVLLNKINVFPVKDADTGTNLVSTVRSIIDSKYDSQNSPHLSYQNRFNKKLISNV